MNVIFKRANLNKINAKICINATHPSFSHCLGLHSLLLPEAQQSQDYLFAVQLPLTDEDFLVGYYVDLLHFILKIPQSPKALYFKNIVILEFKEEMIKKESNKPHTAMVNPKAGKTTALKKKEMQVQNKHPGVWVLHLKTEIIESVF